MGRKRTEAECQEIDARIVEQIAAHQPMAMPQILDKTQMRLGLVDQRLAVLMHCGVIHRTSVGTAKGRYYMYRMGPNPDSSGEDEAAEYFRPVRTSWKLNHKRDSLVAALFGPA